MNRGLVVVVSVLVVAVLAGGFLATMQGPGGTATSTSSGTISVSSSTSSKSSSSVSSTSTVSTSQSTSTTSTGSGGGGYDGLQLRLTVSALSSPNPGSNVTVEMNLAEYNTLSTANNVTMANDWPLGSLSLGVCGSNAYPFGVAVYKGTWDAANVSQATALRIYPNVACPMMIRYITGYLFSPMSEYAVILPGSQDAPTLMAGNITATGTYSETLPMSVLTPLPQGTYSVAAGDEWGSMVVVHFTVGNGSSAATSSTNPGSVGALPVSRSWYNLPVGA